MSLAPGVRTPSDPDGLRGAVGHLAAIAMVAAATMIAIAFERQVRVPNLSLIFVLPVVVAAVGFGWGPALVAAVAGVVAYNFFLIPPLYTFEVADPANVWALGLLLAVGAIASAVAAQSRARALAALEAADRATTLQALARSLAGAADRDAIARTCADALARLFAAPAVVFVDTGETLVPAGQAGGAEVADADREAAQWSLAARLPTRGRAYPASEAAYDFWPVVTPLHLGAVVGVSLAGRDAGRPAEIEPLVEVVVGYLAVALDRDAYAQQVLAARLERAGEQLKADLLAAVSHDLRTPLSTILFSLQSLRKFPEGHDAQARAELLALAEAETTRLTGLVENLLDMNRLDAGAVTPRIAAAAPADLVAGALDQAAPALAGRRVENDVGADAPAVRVDAGLFESALAKVLENAGRYAPAGSAIHVREGHGDAEGWIEVEDEGPGFPGGVEPLLGKFVRGVEGDGRPPGLGLGLSIARGFLAAMGGRIEASNREAGRGARVRLTAPLAGDAQAA